jgi:hypothetical protein
MPTDVTALATELGINDLPAAEQEELVAGFGEVALKAATVAVLEKLPEAKREEFAVLVEAGEAAAVKAFLDKEVPGHEALAGEAVRNEFSNFKEALTKPS